MRTLAAILVVTGCMSDPAQPQLTSLTAQARWNQQAWPALSTCAGCHGGQPAIDFLAPGTADGAYTTVFAFQPSVVDVEVPSASLLVTMGKHTGPALSPEQSAGVLAWLESERDERMLGVGQSVRIGPVLPTPGTAITLDLGVNGATLTLVPDTSEAGLYFSHVTIQAGGGLHVTHPLFVSRPPQPIIDALDRFSALDKHLAAGEQLELGPVWFLDFTATDYLSIHFSTLEAP